MSRQGHSQQPACARRSRHRRDLPRRTRRLPLTALGTRPPRRCRRPAHSPHERLRRLTALVQVAGSPSGSLRRADLPSDPRANCMLSRSRPAVVVTAVTVLRVRLRTVPPCYLPRFVPGERRDLGVQSRRLIGGRCRSGVTDDPAGASPRSLRRAPRVSATGSTTGPFQSSSRLCGAGDDAVSEPKDQRTLATHPFGDGSLVLLAQSGTLVLHMDSGKAFRSNAICGRVRAI